MSNCLFIHGDARRLPIDPKSIDAIVSDPPYGIGNNCDYTRMVSGENWRSTVDYKPIAGDDIPFDPSPWLGFPSVCLWGANFYSDRLPGSGWLIWLKKSEASLGRFLGDCEAAWFNKGKAIYLFHYHWNGLMRDGEQFQFYHPTQKPVALMRWCIQKLKLKPNSLICDPYCGSGSTAIAAEQEGHRFIGLDLDRDYLRIAKHRIDHPNRHIPRPGRPENHPLFAHLGDEAI